MCGPILLVAVLAVLAGCAAPVSPETDGTTTTTVTSAASSLAADSAAESPAATATLTTSPPSTIATVIPTVTPTESPAPEPTTTLTPAPGYGPWGSEPVVVSVAVPDDGRDYAALVSETMAFWEGNDSRYLEYEIDYEVDADAHGPDLVVRFTDGIPVCSRLDDVANCAPYLIDGWQIDRPEIVYVYIEYGDDPVVDIVTHELGHTLGLAHGDEPMDLMNATGILYTFPWTDATEKALLWDDPDFTVHIDDTNVSDPDAAREQVHHAFGYSEGGAPEMPDNLTYTYVDDPADAEARISFADSSPCVTGVASCAIVGGCDPDGDGVLETYGSYRVVLIGLDTEAVGWHVGHWTAHYFGAEVDDGKLEPFRNATYGERRSEQWTQHRRRVVSRALCAVDGGFHPDESAESSFGTTPVERVMTSTDRHGDTHPAFDEESFRDAFAEFGGTDAGRRVVARQACDPADSGQAEADRGAPLTGDEIVRDMRSTSDGDPATRWDRWLGVLEAAYGGYREFQARRISKV